MSDPAPKTTIPCPYCQRSFGDANALSNHMRMKRRTSAAHGLTEDAFPRSRVMIADAMEEAIFDAFGIDPPAGNSRPIRNSGKTATNG